MNKIAQYYRELVASLTERLKNGERDIDQLVEAPNGGCIQLKS
ncbi:hypothetical protein [Yersinia pseudotuberculosis]|nr:hypothetical protein [Yersinia pseudotuberculosis]